MIDDDQIRELRTTAIAAAPRFLDDDQIIRVTTWALGESRWYEGVDCRIPHGLEAAYTRTARARCAEILNARTPATPPVAERFDTSDDS